MTIHNVIRNFLMGAASAITFISILNAAKIFLDDISNIKGTHPLLYPDYSIESALQRMRHQNLSLTPKDIY